MSLVCCEIKLRPLACDLTRKYIEGYLQNIVVYMFSNIFGNSIFHAYGMRCIMHWQSEMQRFNLTPHRTKIINVMQI